MLVKADAYPECNKPLSLAGRKAFTFCTYNVTVVNELQSKLTCYPLYEEALLRVGMLHDASLGRLIAGKVECSERDIHDQLHIRDISL